MARGRKRPSYAEAVAWIARNDEPTWDTAAHAPQVADLISVLLVADLFERSPADVAADVIVYRRKPPVVTS